MTRPVVIDNTVLTNLAIVGRPDLIALIWAGHASTTPEVMDEYRVASEAGLLPTAAWDSLRVVAMTGNEVDAADALSRRLGAGERSCLAVALQRGALVLTDDADARAAARRLGVPVSGTLGVPALAVRRGHLTLAEGDRLLAAMVAAGYRSPVEKLDALI